MIADRLYRCVCKLQWMNKFIGGMVSHLEFWHSDHQPILLDTDPNPFQGSNSLHSQCRFHFEECWAEEVGCESIVNRVWQSPMLNDAMQDFLEKVRLSKV
ncbi:hypothetical protein Dsin_030120 [Dipteronia sinensis]|uniref:Uncharacterized protein n=1 Tax=Dipteronia sinensis TaxID=43782 RepID=A0AAD9ZKH4_9ROSI|nr:hypothetical protein Dsin_030120 [Dipteronia sinensis]